MVTDCIEKTEGCFDISAFWRKSFGSIDWRFNRIADTASVTSLEKYRRYTVDIVSNTDINKLLTVNLAICLQ